MNRKGITVLELLVTTSLVALTITLGALSWEAIQDSVRMTLAIRSVTQALHAARAVAVETGQPARAFWDGQQMLVQEGGETGWQTKARFAPDPRVRVKTNGSPVFFASGMAAPLCTIELDGKRCSCRVTLSIAGRIRALRSVR